MESVGNTMTAREEAIPLLAQLIYDQAHNGRSITVAIHDVSPADFDAAKGTVQATNGHVWKTVVYKSREGTDGTLEAVLHLERS